MGNWHDSFVIAGTNDKAFNRMKLLAWRSSYESETTPLCDARAYLATVAVIVISFGTAGEITVPYFVTGVLIESLGRAVSHKKQVG